MSESDFRRAFLDAAPDLVWSAFPSSLEGGILWVRVDGTDKEYMDIAFRKQKLLKAIQSTAPHLGVIDIRWERSQANPAEPLNYQTPRRAKESSYSEKLRDPRWQKKRLEILNRDEWTCQACFDKDSTLNVHHRYYEHGKDPWDYEDYVLVTLCEDCHKAEGPAMKEALRKLSRSISAIFLSSAVDDIASGFLAMELAHAPDVVAKSIAWALLDAASQQLLVERYLEVCKNAGVTLLGRTFTREGHDNV